MYSAFDGGRYVTAGPQGLRGSGSNHSGALFGAMTKRSVPIQVLTILPCCFLLLTTFGPERGLCRARCPVFLTRGEHRPNDSGRFCRLSDEGNLHWPAGQNATEPRRS